MTERLDNDKRIDNIQNMTHKTSRYNKSGITWLGMPSAAVVTTMAIYNLQFEIKVEFYTSA